jgi:hypothetical protein
MPTPKLSNSIILAAIEGFEAQKKRIDEQVRELRQILNGGPQTEPSETAPPKRKKRRLSAAGRRAIAEATRRRWAAVRAAKERTSKQSAVPPKAVRRKVSKGVAKS